MRRIIELSRSLRRDNSHAGRFFQQWAAGVVGGGFQLKSLPMDDDGSVDEAAAKAIEEAWEEWQRPENCTVQGELSWDQFKNISEQTVGCDGGVLLNPVRGYAGNRFGFAVQALEVDRMDIDYSMANNGRGGSIINGKEVNQWGAPVGYHILPTSPGEYATANGGRRTFISADRIIHRFYPERLGASQGTPLVMASMSALRHLEKYEEAEVIAARIHACATMAVTDDGDPISMNMDDEDDEIFNQTFQAELSAGGMIAPPSGKSIDLLQSQHPNSAYPDFKKAVLRGASAYLNYNNIGDDLEGVNYSSLREGKLQQNAIFKPFQKLNIDREERPIFEAWLEVQLVLGNIKINGKALPLSKLEKFKRARFLPPRMPWVDPQKEANAIQTQLEMGMTSLSRVVAETQNTSLEEIIKERERDVKLFTDAGLPVPEWAAGGTPPPLAMAGVPAMSEPANLSEDDEEDID